MTETVELRNTPALKIIFHTSEFEIIDVSEPKNSGFYAFEEIKNVRLNPEKTDKFISALSWILDFFAGGGSVAGKYKNKANLQLEMVTQNLKIWLVDSDFEKAKMIAHKLNKKSRKQ